MRRRTSFIVAILASGFWSQGWCDPSVTESEFALGVQAYQQERWNTALGHFVEVIEEDPSNDQAHSYVKLIMQKLESQQERKNHEDQLNILTATSKLLDEHSRDSRVIDNALRRTTSRDAERQKAQWHAQCVEAQMEAQLGHLPTANDLVLQVIAEDSNNQEAQLLLSDLQSQIHQALNSGDGLPLAKRLVLEGFYAYGQADYASAVEAWAHARSALGEGTSPTEAAHQVALLHFDTYDKEAHARLEEVLQWTRLRAIFAEGMSAYSSRNFEKSLEAFRQVALINPDYPELGSYLANSIAAVDRQRTQNLSDDKRQQASDAFAKGVANMEKGKYSDAQAAFEQVLALDPAHPRARQYIQQIETQKSQKTDPEAAQQHYETGLVAYASHDYEGAVREWHIALRLDPDNPKIVTAVKKGQRELALSKELP